MKVGNQHYPGTLVYARVDGGKVFQSEEPGWRGAEAEELIETLISGEQAVLRYSEWPYEGHIDRDVSLYGLNVAVLYVDEYIKGETP